MFSNFHIIFLPQYAKETFSIENHKCYLLLHWGYLHVRKYFYVPYIQCCELTTFTCSLMDLGNNLQEHGRRTSMYWFFGKNRLWCFSYHHHITRDNIITNSFLLFRNYFPLCGYPIYANFKSRKIGLILQLSNYCSVQPRKLLQFCSLMIVFKIAEMQ